MSRKLMIVFLAAALVAGCAYLAWAAGTADAQKHYETAVKLAGSDVDKAIVELKAAIEDDSHYIKAYLLLSQLLADKKKDLSGALAWLDKGLALEPENVDLLLGRGNLLLIFGGQGHLQEAIASLRKALKIDDDLILGHVLLARALGKLGSSAEALAEYDKAIALSGKAPEILSEKGHYCLAIKKVAEAEKLFKQALAAKADLVSARAGLIAVYQAQGKYDQALKEADTLLKQRPKDPALLAQIGTFHLLKKDYTKAVSWLKQAIAANANYAPAHYNLACAYALTGKADEALDELAKAIALEARYRKMAKDDPDLASLRNDPRFIKLVTE